MSKAVDDEEVSDDDVSEEEDEDEDDEIPSKKKKAAFKNPAFIQTIAPARKTTGKVLAARMMRTTSLFNTHPFP